MIGNTMTPARQRRKSSLGGAMAVAAAVAAACVAGLRLAAATTEYVVVDRNSGLAISGFDPVAYFTDATASLGRGEFEYSFAGAVWRFRNEGNRAAFADDPATYMPRYGGYDPAGVARGVAVAGDPRLWVIAGERLYFFYTEQTRAEFRKDPQGVTASADKAWPAVQRTLSP